jgi:hypothetical protein
MHEGHESPQSPAVAKPLGADGLSVEILDDDVRLCLSAAGFGSSR